MSSHAGRKAPTSQLRRVSQLSLGAGAVIGAALAAAVAVSPWLPVAGVVIAIIGAVVAVLAAWREHRELRRQRDAELSQQRHAHGDQMNAVRAEHADVLKVLEQRGNTMRAEISELRDENGVLRTENGELKMTVSQLRGDNESLRLENDALRVDNGKLIAANSEIIAKLESLEEGESAVVVLPRRRASENNGVVWSEDEAPTVVELNLARLATPFVEDALRQAN